MINPSRRLLGRSSFLFSREAVWQIPDGLEIESSEQYEIVRRQVLFQDVISVTYHRMYGAGFVIATGLGSLFFIGMAMLIVVAGGTESWVGALVMLIIGSPIIVACVLRLMFRLDVITVFGRRSRASIRFSLRKQRARTLYAQICAAVKSAQDRMAREIAAEDAAATPVVTEELPPMPPVTE